MVVQGIGLGSSLRTQNRNISNLFLVSGISTEGDGLGGVFYWNPSSTAADDSMNVFQVSGVATGRWIRIANSIATSSPLTYSSGVLDITQSGVSTSGYLSSTDWNTFNNKQSQITLTTIGSSGAATFASNTLNIPDYSSALTGYVPTSRTLTINGTTYDLSANRTWTISSGTVTSVDATVPTGFTVSGVPITSSGTIAISFDTGYALPTTAKQTEWDAAYTWVAAFPSQTGQAGKFLTTDGSILSWAAGGTVTSVDMSVPTGLSISGNPITTFGTLALTYASGYSIPTNVKQSNWDDAYTWVSNFPTQTGNNGKFLTTDGSALSWAVVDLSNYVPITRELTINGTAYDLSANRSWSVGTVTSVGLIVGTAGTDISVSNSPVTSSGDITIDIPTASTTARGALSSTDWTTFNNKQDTITLTTTGTSGAATFAANTLNIPQYQGQITLTTTGVSGAATFIGDTLNIPNYQGLVPSGGTDGQILAKIDGTNYNTHWIDNFTTDVREYVKAAQAIDKGQAVYVSGADGTNILVSKASNTTEATSSKVLGLLAQNLALNGHGYVITQGLLDGLDTSTATIGDPVWLGTNGNLIYGLVNKPYAPAHLVYLGVVTRVNVNNGEIFVQVQNGFELRELHDVVAVSPVDGAFIKYNSSNSLWESVAGTTTNVAEGTNLYFTNDRARSAISLTTTGNNGASTYSTLTGVINVPEYTIAGLGGVPDTRTLTINGTAYDLTANRSWSVGTVTNVSFATDASGTDIAVSGSPITSSGTITLSIPVASATNTGKLSAADWSTFNNKQNALTFGNLTETTSSILTITGGTGAVIGSGVTIAVSQASGTVSGYLSSADWTTFNNKQAAITLTTTGNSGAATFITNTLNIPEYTLSGLGGVPTSRTITINGTSYDLSANRTWSVGTVTSVGISMPSAFTVSNSPVTGSGTLTVTGAGTTSQYVRGDGTLADFPGGTGGGGASVSYYLNGGTNQGTFGGNTYYEMSKTAVTGSAANFTASANGYIAQFLTDAGDPALLNIPAGNWDIQAYFSVSSSGGTPSFYVELYKYDGTSFTLIASNSASPEVITGGTSVDLYYTALAVPSTSLTLTDRLAIRIYVTPDTRTVTFYTQNNRLAQIVTTFSTGITALNGLTAQVQTLSTGTSGSDFNISSATSTHTLNLPVASATNTGKLSNTDWTTFNNKQNALTFGNLTEATSSVLTITGGTGAVIGSGTTIQVKQASGSVSGFLSSTDWTTFNNKLTSPMTTLGDIIYGGASGAATRLAGNTTAVKQYLSQTGTGTVSAAPSWATIDGGDITGYALTKTDDTNVTLTLGGTPATALLKAVSITVGWTGTLSIARGGTGASSKAAAFDALSPMTTLGDTIYGSTSGANTRLAGNITTAKQYLSQTGTGTASAAPIWATIAGSDITGAALTKTDDTNVTLTLGGTPATALLRAASITVGWAGTLATTRGGTGLSAYTLGDIIYASAANTLSALAGNTTATKQFLSQTGTGTASAAPAWATLTGSDITGAALTKTDDTNVTLTLGGTPATALLRAASLTLGWTGNLAIARGGTGAITATAAFDNLAPTTTLGDTIYHNGTDNVRLAGNTTTTRKFLRQTGTGTVSAAPAWDTLISGDIPDLSGTYLPLIGGTLTGALIGTSATFSGDLTVDTNTLYVDSTNNRVGIGTLTPRSTADVNGVLTVGDGNPPAINIYRNVALGNNASFGSINFGGRYDATNYGIGASIYTNTVGAWSSTNYGGNLIFATTPQNSTTLTERLRIASTGAATFSSSISATSATFSGNVDIGTSGGTRKLTVYQASAGVYAQYISQQASTSNSYGLLIDAGTNSTDATLRIRSKSGTDYFYIRGDGNVGIGSTAPSGKLEVNTASGTAYFTRTAGDNGTTSPALGIATAATVTRIYSYGDSLQFWTAAVGGTATQKITLDSSGNLGLGVTPSAWGTGNSVIAIQLNSGAIWSFSTTSLNIIQNAYFNGTSYIYSTTAAATRFESGGGGFTFRVAPSGTVGTAATFSTALTIENTGAAIFSSNVTINGGNYLKLNESTNTNHWQLYTYTDNSFRMNYNGAGNDEFIMSSTGAATFSSTASFGGNVTVTQADARLILNGTSALARIQYQNNGVTKWYAGINGYTDTNGYSIDFETTPYLFVKSDGNIGINNSNPLYKLDIGGSVAAANNFEALRMFNSSDGGVKMIFSNSVAAELASITAGVTSTGAGTDDGVLLFRTSSNAVAADRMSINATGTVRLNAYTTNGLLYVSGGTGTISSAARTINGTTFNGSANITTANWGTARTITIGSTGKSVNGSANVSWTAAEIGLTSYLPLIGGTLTGNLTLGSGSDLIITPATSGGNATLYNDIGNLVSTASLEVQGTGSFTSSVSATGLYLSTSNGLIGDINSSNANGGYMTWQTSGTVIADLGTAQQIFGSGGNDTFGINGRGARALVFGTNNTERLRITSGGNVGIGTSNPGQLLTLGGTASPQLSIVSNTTTGSSEIYFGDSGAVYRGFIGYYHNGDYMTFNTAAAEKMRITSGGNVGIGTTSPASILHLYQANPELIYEGTSSYKFSTGVDTNGWWVYKYGTGAGYKFVITSSGNVGIGTNSPEALLHVNKSTAGGEGGYIFIDNPAASTLNNKAGIRFATNSGATFANYGSAIEAVNTNASNGAEALTFSTWNGSARSERMRLAASGNLLIGETSDTTSKLVVRKDAAGGRGGEISIVNYAASTLNSSAALNFGLEASTYDADNGNAQIKAQITNAGNSASAMMFSTWNGSAFGERMRITSDGEVWINSTTDAGAYQLQVSGSTYSSSGFFESSDIRLKTVLNTHYGADFGAIEYTWNDGRDDKKHWGYSAQEVMKYIPDAVNENNDGYYSLDYNQAHTYKIAMLEKEIRELKAKLGQ